MSLARSPKVDHLTSQQLLAIASPLSRVFLEAEPGSGKTTVAASRFGALRFRTAAAVMTANDSRSVTALSFTRSATAELRGRVLQQWGGAALRRPHRIITIDTLIHELVEHLLLSGAVRWPGGHERLEVFDSWAVLAPSRWIYAQRSLVLDGTDVAIQASRAREPKNRPHPGEKVAAIYRGVCTHDDVRAVLGAAIATPQLRALLVERIRSTTRAVIVDEVFDANRLDLGVVALFMDAESQVTLVGDPWQALYGFRGAQPHLVPGLVTGSGTTTLPLSATFRWKDDAQRDLADALRSGTATTLPSAPLADVDVVLARQWKQLWEADPSVLPIAIGSPKGTVPEATATLLLSCLTRRVHGEDGPYVRDALSTLRIDPAAFAKSAEPKLHRVLECLAEPGTPALKDAYAALVDLFQPLSNVVHPAVHHNYTARLGLIRDRLRFKGRLIPGMTAHQAKGREWDKVGVCLAPDDTAALAKGLTSTSESHRQLYVAGTRARYQTVAV